MMVRRTRSAPSPRWGEGGVRGARFLDRFEPPHPNPLPNGERERTEFAARLRFILQVRRRYASMAATDSKIDREDRMKRRDFLAGGMAAAAFGGAQRAWAQ